MNVYSLLNDAIRRHPDRIAFARGPRGLAYAEFDRVVAGLCAHFATLGCLAHQVRVGDRRQRTLRRGYINAALGHELGRRSISLLQKR